MEKGSSNNIKQPIEKSKPKSAGKVIKSTKKKKTPSDTKPLKSKPSLTNKCKSVQPKTTANTTQKTQPKSAAQPKVKSAQVKQPQSVKSNANQLRRFCSPFTLKSHVKSAPIKANANQTRKANPSKVIAGKSIKSLNLPKSVSSFKSNNSIISSPNLMSDKIDLNDVMPFFSRLQNSKTKTVSSSKILKSKSSENIKKKTVTKLSKILQRCSSDRLKISDLDEAEVDFFEVELTITCDTSSIVLNLNESVSPNRFPPLPRMSPTKNRESVSNFNLSATSKSCYSIRSSKSKSPSFWHPYSSSGSQKTSSVKSKTKSKSSISAKSKKSPPSSRKSQNNDKSKSPKYSSKKSLKQSSSKTVLKSKSKSSSSSVRLSPKTSANKAQIDKSWIKNGVKKPNLSDLKKKKKSSVNQKSSTKHKSPAKDKNKVEANYKTNKTKNVPESQYSHSKSKSPSKAKTK